MVELKVALVGTAVLVCRNGVRVVVVLAHGREGLLVIIRPRWLPVRMVATASAVVKSAWLVVHAHHVVLALEVRLGIVVLELVVRRIFASE